MKKKENDRSDYQHNFIVEINDYGYGTGPGIIKLLLKPYFQFVEVATYEVKKRKK